MKKTNYRVMVLVTDGIETKLVECDAIELQAPAIRLVFEWGSTERESQLRPSSYADVPLPNLQKVSDGLFVLTNPQKVAVRGFQFSGIEPPHQGQP